MRWPTLEEFKIRFKEKNDNYINEVNLKSNVYLLFSDIFDIDGGESLCNYFDSDTILAVVKKSYIPTSDDIDYISKMKKWNRSLVISYLFTNVYELSKENIVMNAMKDVNVNNTAIVELDDIYEDKHTLSNSELNPNYKIFLTRVEVLESLGDLYTKINSDNYKFSEDDPYEIRKWIREQIRNRNTGRLENKNSIKRLTEIDGWTWDLLEFKLRVIENNLSNKNKILNRENFNLITKNEDYIYNNVGLFPNITILLVDIKEKINKNKVSITIINDVLSKKIHPKKIEQDIIDSFVYKTNIKTLENIGKNYKLSREAVRQIKRKLYSKLFHPSTLYYIEKKYGAKYLEAYMNRFDK
jgi:hypothetical protein